MPRSASPSAAGSRYRRARAAVLGGLQPEPPGTRRRPLRAHSHSWTYRLLFLPFCGYLMLWTVFTMWVLLAVREETAATISLCAIASVVVIWPLSTAIAFIMERSHRSRFATHQRLHTDLELATARLKEE